MNKNINYYLFFALFTLFQLNSSFAQKKRSSGGDDAKGHSVGFSIGPAWVLSDLGGANKISSPFLKDIDFQATRFGLSVFHKYSFNEWVAVRTNMMWAMLEGSDRLIGGPEVYATKADVNDAFFRKVRNLDFKTHVFQLTGTAEVNLKKYSPYAYGRGDKLRWAPYVGGGFGVFFFNPFTKSFNGQNVASNPHISLLEAQSLSQYQGEKIKLRKLGTEGKVYAPVHFNLSGMLGIKFNVSPSVTLALEGWYHQTFTDRLDDVSGNYPDLSTYLTMSPLQKAMSVRYFEVANSIDPNGFYSNSIWDKNGMGLERGDDNVDDAKGKNDQFFNINITVLVNLPVRNKSFGCGSRGAFNHKFSCPKW